MIFKNLLTLFGESKTKEIDAVELWYVRWMSRHGEYSSHIQPVVEAFTSKEQADEFANTLRAACKVLKYTENIGISVGK